MVGTATPLPVRLAHGTGTGRHPVYHHYTPPEEDLFEGNRNGRKLHDEPARLRTLAGTKPVAGPHRVPATDRLEMRRYGTRT
jgi:hypothetical protein